mgnify:CR=1 FL=1
MSKYDIEIIIGDRTAVGHLSLLVIVYLYDLYDRGVEDRDSLHTMPGYCYLTPVWDISIVHPLLCLCQCYPTLRNYYL